MKTRLPGGGEVLGPRKSRYVAKEAALLCSKAFGRERLVGLVPSMETRRWGYERPFTGLLGPRESPCVTYGSAISFLYGNKAFGWERASWSPEEPLVLLLLAPYMQTRLFEWERASSGASWSPEEPCG